MDEDSERIQRLVNDEFFDVKLYELVISHVKNEKERRILRRLLEKERKDLEALMKLHPHVKPRLNHLKLWFYFLLYRLFGYTFVIKLAESNEEEVLNEYRRLLQEEKDGEDKKLLRRLIRSTKRYEYMLRSWIKEERLKYLSFMALGVVDGIISLMGTQAGFLGATGESLKVGVYSLIVGVATAVSMAAATFLQAKEMQNGVNPWRAMVYGGSTYLSVTALLVLPYFLFSNPYVAFMVALILSMVVLAVFTFYSSVVHEKDFWKEFRENVAVVGIAALVGFAVGSLADRFIL
ncbi:MAG: hypothetical protein GXO00_00645 [Candidatus Diapherotrites archaeon]|nr:hypothetical protein [Candidatus Diapherotrites archaeon]